MNSQEDQTFLTKIPQMQQEYGINMQNFQKKFLYSGNDSTGYFLERGTPSPSNLKSISIEQENQISYLMSELISLAGESLQVPISTTIVAQTLAHYVFSRKSFLEYDFREIAMGAMFLACKSEETLRKSYIVAVTFDYVFKVLEGTQKKPSTVEFNSVQYTYMKEMVIKSQLNILFQLGFDIHELLDIPHRYISGLLQMFEKHPKSNQISRSTWAYLNDSYKTRVCLYYPGNAIAAASLLLSLRKMQIALPLCPWWVLMGASLELIQEIGLEIESLCENSPKTVNFASIQNILNGVGSQNGIDNVFPVPYYRKIMLSKQNQQKIIRNNELEDTPEEEPRFTKPVASFTVKSELKKAKILAKSDETSQVSNYLQPNKQKSNIDSKLSKWQQKVGQINLNKVEKKKEVDEENSSESQDMEELKKLRENHLKQKCQQIL